MSCYRRLERLRFLKCSWKVTLSALFIQQTLHILNGLRVAEGFCLIPDGVGDRKREQVADVNIQSGGLRENALGNGGEQRCQEQNDEIHEHRLVVGDGMFFQIRPSVQNALEMGRIKEGSRPSLRMILIVFVFDSTALLSLRSGCFCNELWRGSAGLEDTKPLRQDGRHLPRGLIDVAADVGGVQNCCRSVFRRHTE
jgi:hypothetical protein